MHSSGSEHAGQSAASRYHCLMSGVNQITIVGYVDGSPELKFSQEGTPYCRFSVAVNEEWKKDGFKAYKPDANNSNSLGGLFVSALFEDRSGILCIGADQGLNRFDPATERFTHFRDDPDNPNGISGFPEHITQDRDGMLRLATHNGLDRLDPSSGRFTRYRNDPNDPHSLSSNDVRFVLEGRQGTLWVATAAGLDAVDRRTGRVLRYPSSQQPPLHRATANDGPETTFHFTLPKYHQEESNAGVAGT